MKPIFIIVNFTPFHIDPFSVKHSIIIILIVLLILLILILDESFALLSFYF